MTNYVMALRKLLLNTTLPVKANISVKSRFRPLRRDVKHVYTAHGDDSVLQL